MLEVEQERGADAAARYAALQVRPISPRIGANQVPGTVSKHIKNVLKNRLENQVSRI